MKFITGALLAVWLCTIPAEQTVAQSFREAFKQAARDALNGKRSIYRYGQSKQTDPVLPKIALKCESKEEAKALANYLREHLQVPVIVQKKTCNVITNMSKKELQTWIEKYKASLNQNEASINSKSKTANTSTTQGGKIVSLVVNGEAPTKEEATQIALRSAIEQTFGTFVSANTEVLNDEITKDEIATIASGNIQSYQELSCIDLANGNKSVSLQAVVSIDKLVSYAQSKGMTAELAGATFAMNIKMKELNRKNEVEAVKNMIKQLEEIAGSGMFDFELITTEPKFDKNSNLYYVSLDINVLINSKAVLFHQILHNTLRSLSLTENEANEYQAIELPTFSFLSYTLRNDVRNAYADYIDYLLQKAGSSFYIMDNIGTQLSPSEILYIRKSIYGGPGIRELCIASSIYKKGFFNNKGEALRTQYIFYDISLIGNSERNFILTGIKNKGATHRHSNDFFVNEKDLPQLGNKMTAFYIDVYYTLDELSKVTSFKVDHYKMKSIIAK